MKKALVLVDLENEWVDKNSDYFIGNTSKMLKKTNKLIDYCKKKKMKIIFIQHIEKDSTESFVEGSKNVQIISAIKRDRSDVIITKNKISPFYKTTLEKELKGIEEIIISGILTNLCVRSLVQDAYDRNFGIIIIKDCCVAMDKKTHNFTLKDLKNTRPEIKIMSVEEFVK